jgi:putative transposase
VAQRVGFIKGAFHIAGDFSAYKGNFTSQNYRAKGYYVPTGGKDQKAVAGYIRQQEMEDRRLSQLKMSNTCHG